MKFEDLPFELQVRMEMDAFIFGNGYCIRNDQGEFERVDPLKVQIILDKDGKNILEVKNE